jgi:hypothetical protein
MSLLDLVFLLLVLRVDAVCQDCLPPVCACNGDTPCPFPATQAPCPAGNRPAVSFTHRCSYRGQFVGTRAVLTMQVGSVADFTLLAVRSFDSLPSFDNYSTCQPYQPFESRTFSSCTGAVSMTADGPDLTVAAECLGGDASCVLYWSASGVCSQAATPGIVALGIISIVCCSVVLAAAVALVIVSLRNAAQFSKMLWLMLGLAVLMSVCSVAYWSLFVQLMYAAGLGVASVSMFILDVAIIGESCALSLYRANLLTGCSTLSLIVLLFQWMMHVHPLRTVLLTRLFVVVALVFVALCIALAVASAVSLTGHSDIFFKYSGGLFFGLYSTLYALACIVCVLLLYYGIRVQRSLQRDGVASRFLLSQGLRRFFFLLFLANAVAVVVVLVCSVVRLALGLYWVAWQVIRHTNPTGDYTGMSTFPNAMFFYPSLR